MEKEILTPLTPHTKIFSRQIIDLNLNCRTAGFKKITMLVWVIREAEYKMELEENYQKKILLRENGQIVKEAK